MEIIRVIPSGYCQGVVRAIRIAKQTAEQYPDEKITMLGMIVHNQYLVDACRKIGIHFVEDTKKTRFDLLDEVNEGIVIFTAHGVSDATKQKAEKKGLKVVDATCVDVQKTHDLVISHAQKGDIIYIGKKNHPEAEGTIGLSPRVHLVTKADDVNDLPELHNVLITNQTTLSILDTQKIIEACLVRYPEAQTASEICNATRIRQEVVLNLKDKNIDALIVVGDPRSNNSRQLANTGEKAGIHDSYLIADANALTKEMLENKNRIAVTSGSSTPTALTMQVIDCLKQYAETGILNLPVKIPEVL